MGGAKEDVLGFWEISIEGQSGVLCMARSWSETSGAFLLDYLLVWICLTL
jgi:hypothetical protein